MKKIFGKIETNKTWRIVGSILTITTLMILYNLQGSLLSQAINLKLKDGDTSYDKQISFEILYIIFFLIIILLAIILYLKLTQRKPFERFTLKKLKITFLLFGTSVIVQVILGILDQLINGNLQTANNREIEEIASLGPDFAVVILTTAVLLSPIFEEIIYRGLVIDGIFLEHRKIGIFIQALLFGASHSVDNVIQFLTFFATGLFLGFIYSKTDNLSYSILGHFCQNLIAAGMMVYGLLT